MVEAVWELTKEWEGLWATWKVDKFTELQTPEMETHSVNIFKKLNKYSRELKVNKANFTCMFYFLDTY